MSTQPPRRRGKPAQRDARNARPGGRGGPNAQQRSGAGPPRRASAGARRGPNAQRRDPSAGREQSAPRGLGGDHVEGRQAVRELLRAGNRKIHEILLAEDAHESAVLAEIADLAAERRVPVRETSRRKLRDRALTESPQGVIASAAEIRPVPLEDLVQPHRGSTPLLIAADGVTDPGNLGAILRTAEVAGATGVVLGRHRAASLTPAAVKAAAGAIEHLRFAQVGGLPGALKQLRDAGLWVIGLDGDASDGLEDLRVASEPVVVVVGAEGRGLSTLVERRCDQVISIPIYGRIESLNVAAATAVALFDSARARARAQNST